jgi:multidrug efflux system outer membrane protein
VRAHLLTAVAALASSCTLGPDYARPEVEIPPGWRVDYEAVADLADTKWWEQFGDPVLDGLIESALRQNLDLAVAAARVERFLGVLSTTRSQLFPQVGYSLDGSYNRVSENGPDPLPPGADRDYSLYQGSIAAVWQIDLFGRVRRLSEAAQADVYASEQGRRGVVLSVVTSVANAYVALRALDRQLEIANATADNYLGTLRIFEMRHDGGVVSQLELSQIRSQYQQALATIPAIEQQIAVQENAISVLLGNNPGPIPRGRTLDELTPPGIPGDLPAALLERRPDVLEAEQNLVAANADIGAAKALWFPTISLTGFFGTASTDIEDFLDSSSKAWSAGGGLTGPIFNAGAISGQVQSAEAGYSESLAFYRSVLLNAFRETNDALIGAQKKALEASAQGERVAALNEYARLARLRFDNGYAAYLEVLYAENELFLAELSAARSVAERHAEIIGVYRAMGGGWIDVADPLASTASGEQNGDR